MWNSSIPAYMECVTIIFTNGWTVVLILIKLLSLKSGAFAGVHDCISGPPPFFFYSVIASDGLFTPAEEVSLEENEGVGYHK